MIIAIKDNTNEVKTAIIALLLLFFTGFLYSISSENIESNVIL